MSNSKEVFKWEEAYTEGINIRVLQENAEGSMEDAVRRIIMEEKQRRRGERPSKVRLGMMRYVYVGVDLSATVLANDFEPNRFRAAQKCLLEFFEKFFELNPLSMMGIIVGREKRAERICSFTSSTQLLREAMSNLGEMNSTGEFSLQSVLETALHTFQNVPAHTSKECILLVSSLSTVDAVNLRHIYEQLRMRSIRCTVISFSAEVFAFKKLSIATQGKYGVALDNEHLTLLLGEHVQPPPLKKEKGQQDSIVRMGFPQKRKEVTPSFCACHELIGEALPAESNRDHDASARAFFCPQCGIKYCQTPMPCRICGLLLLTAPQLARASKHLDPLPAFSECVLNEGTSCFACDELLPISTKAYKCKNCETKFCIECDILLHESLQVCPSCG